MDNAQNTIAMIYDFDGTLTPRPMQDYAILPQLKLDAAAFWDEVGTEAKQTGAENMLVYMRKLLEKAQEAHVHIRKEDYANLAANIRYYRGVEEWFALINQYVQARTQAVNIKHYIISAGMKEILDGISIGQHFAQIYASEYYFDFRGIATFPKLVITDTSKTQYLFRINKGIEDLRDNINGHMPEALRPIPFKNMIYLGDGLTDVPSMALTLKEGGHAVAVFDDQNQHQHQVCQQLLHAKRVDFIAPADYQAGSVLHQRIQLLLNQLISEIEYRQMRQQCLIENPATAAGAANTPLASK